MTQHVDVLIVGAGLSGIGAAVHLQKAHPHRSFAIFEARDAIGGTWDLFRYPGIRSDSDMFTLGYVFKPWTDSKAIADGPSILRYVRETAAEHGIDRHIRFRHRVVRATWSSADACWTVEADVDGERVRTTCQFLYVCSGYYRYDAGYTPDFPGRDRYRGTFVHPQHWPEDLDYEGKKVVVIGSGATAVTLVPAMAEKAAHVTMLQRTPTYIASLPSEDAIANFLRENLPAELAYGLSRWKNILLSMVLYQLARKSPKGTKRRLLKLAAKELPPDFDLETHLSPDYAPWDQRLCLVPDADLFKAIRRGTASVVTDRITTFTEEGIALESGQTLEADVIVTATGLNLLAFGGMELRVDGEGVDIARRMTYKGMMLEGVPNFAFAIGYTNASWTLKCDLTAMYLCRLLDHLEAHGQAWCRPQNTDPEVTTVPLLDFQAGYVLRSLDQFPTQGSKTPWKLSLIHI